MIRTCVLGEFDCLTCNLVSVFDAMNKDSFTDPCSRITYLQEILLRFYKFHLTYVRLKMYI